MIKCFCDECGKEITGNVNTVSETTEITDCFGGVIMELRSGVSHICDECKDKELYCGFKVGDEVITYEGRVGTIIDICTCPSCRERGFFEPEVQYDDGDIDYIMISDRRNGFSSFYKIGNQIFGNLDDSYPVARIEILQDELRKFKKQLDVIRSLKKN
jgi:hypothetical protein